MKHLKVCLCQCRLPVPWDTLVGEAPALDSDITHEYSDYKIPALGKQMSLADFTQFHFLI